jgi:ABC-type bacteriocin/lantibiotic exporter with double-glycine peptidase domain
MAFVKQRTKADCGVAALAMLCDVKYEKAYDAIDWRPSSTIHGLDTRQLRDAADKLGYNTYGGIDGRLLPCGPTRWRAIPSRSLVKIPNPNGQGMWHWVVWKGNKVYDPARGVFKASVHGGVPTSYLRFSKRSEHHVD